MTMSSALCLDSPITLSSALAYLMPQEFSAMHWYIPESSKVKLENFNSPFPYWAKKKKKKKRFQGNKLDPPATLKETEI